MILFSIFDFAARRRVRQEELDDALTPYVEEALNSGEYDDLLDYAEQTWQALYEEESERSAPDFPKTLRNQIERNLDLVEEPSPASVSRVAIWMGTLLLNSATVKAARDDPDELFIEWVTMRDSEVRHAHRLTGGQQRPIGEPFDVDGTEMRYPGDPTAPIELWINCRCVVRPVLAEEALAASIAARDVPTEERKKDAKAGRAMPDGSYPIDNCSDLANAIQAIGRAKDPGPVKSHIKRRKSSLGCPDVSIPEGWANEEEVTMTATEIEVEPEVGTWEGPVPWHGVLAPEGVASGDGRTFAPDSLTNRDLPLPLTWQKVSDDGHKGSVTVAKIETLERINGLMHASGHFLQIPEADEVVGLLAEFGKFGVSVDADDAEMQVDEESGGITFTKARIASASIVAIPAFAEAWVSLGTWDEDTTVAGLDDMETETDDVCDPESPDYDQAACEAKREKAKEPPVYRAEVPVFVKTEDGPGWLTHPVDTDRLRDYWVRGEGALKIGWGSPGDFDRCRANLAKYVKPQYLNGYCANRHYDALGFWPGRPVAGDTVGFDEVGEALSLIAAGAPKPPASWFDNPEFTSAQPLTITEDGQVFGHVAQWGVCHVTYSDECMLAPPSSSGYAYFMLGEVLTDGGSRPVGALTIGGGHAPGHLRARPAMAHYDSTSSVFAHVAAGEDAHGIWVAGYVPPGVPDEKVIMARGAKLSGDWRRVGGQMEMVAALAVNVPGFPVPRLAASVQDGVQVSLVAAGVLHEGASNYLQEDPDPERIARLSEKVSASLKKRLAQAAARVEG